jgi:hypothetical protein
MAFPPPKTSKTQDNFTHHSSPTPGLKQTPAPIPVPPKKAVPRAVTGTINNRSVPDHVTKHSEPVGRPRGSVTTGPPAEREMAQMEREAKKGY